MNSPKKTNERIAGNTAVPLAAEIISRIAPILGVKPELDGSSSIFDYDKCVFVVLDGSFW